MNVYLLSSHLMEKGAGELRSRLERAMKAGDEVEKQNYTQGFCPAGGVVFHQDARHAAGAQSLAPLRYLNWGVGLVLS
jgi:hypothetical protein